MTQLVQKEKKMTLTERLRADGEQTNKRISANPVRFLAVVTIVVLIVAGAFVAIGYIITR